jgi:hypothetical protein
MITAYHKRTETPTAVEKVTGPNPRTRWKNVNNKKFKIQGGPMARSNNPRSILKAHTTQSNLQINHKLSNLMPKEGQNMWAVKIVSKTRPTY